MRNAAFALCSLFLAASAPDLAAQFAEPSTRVLVDESSGSTVGLFGWAVAALGDVDRDGYTDVAASAPFHNRGAGKVLAISGRDGSILWELEGTAPSGLLGYALESMFWNDDAVLDLVAGAPFSPPGRVLVLSGIDGSTLATLDGEGTGGSGFGASLAASGDFDGDNRYEMLVAAPYLATSAGAMSGRVYVYERGSSTPFATLDGPHAGARFGAGLAFVGHTTLPLSSQGEIAIGYRDGASFFDGFVGVFEWNGTNAVRRYLVEDVGMGFELNGEHVDGGVDVNTDGFHDFVVGDTFRSVVKVFSGQDGTLLRTLSEAGESGLYGAARLLLDRTGDGIGEIAVGARQSDSGGVDSGRVYVYSGADGTLIKTITPTTPGGQIGTEVCELDDLDGDDKFDLAVGTFGDRLLVISGYVAAPGNVEHAAQLASDPVLTDVGGDPTAGPISGSLTEVFNLALDCSAAPQDGLFAIRVRRQTLATPRTVPAGWLWIHGPLLFQRVGFQTRNVVTCAPSGFAVPRDFGLIGLRYGAQGACGRRLSNAITQVIGF